MKVSFIRKLMHPHVLAFSLAAAMILIPTISKAGPQGNILKALEALQKIMMTSPKVDKRPVSKVLADDPVLHSIQQYGSAANLAENEALYKILMNYDERNNEAVREVFENKDGDPTFALWGEYVRTMRKLKLPPITVHQMTNLFWGSLTSYDHQKKNKPERKGAYWHPDLGEILKAGDQCEGLALAKTTTNQQIMKGLSQYDGVDVYTEFGWCYNPQGNFWGRHAVAVMEVDGHKVIGDIQYIHPLIDPIAGIINNPLSLKHGGIEKASVAASANFEHLKLFFVPNVTFKPGKGQYGFSFIALDEKSPAKATNDTESFQTPEGYVSVPFQNGTLDLPEWAANPKTIQILSNLIDKAKARFIAENLTKLNEDPNLKVLREAILQLNAKKQINEAKQRGEIVQATIVKTIETYTDENGQLQTRYVVNAAADNQDAANNQNVVIKTSAQRGQKDDPRNKGPAKRKNHKKDPDRKNPREVNKNILRKGL